MALYRGPEEGARRSRTAFYATVLFLLALVAGAAVVFWPRNDARPDPAVVVEAASNAGEDTAGVRWAADFDSAVRRAASEQRRVLFVVFTAPGAPEGTIEIGPGTMEKLHQVAVPLVADPLKETALAARLKPTSYPYVFILSPDGQRIYRESPWPVIGMNVADFIELGADSAASYGRWLSDLDEARRAARDQGKKLFIMAACGENPSMIEELKMDMGVDPIVAPLLDEFILLSVEDEAGCDQLVDEGFISFPIIAIYDPAQNTYINEDRLSADLLFTLPSFLRGD